MVDKRYVVIKALNKLLNLTHTLTVDGQRPMPVALPAR